MKKILFLFSILFLFAHPGYAGFMVSSDLLQQKTIQPGETFEGTIVLSNSGDTSAEVKASRADFRFFSDGRNEFGAPGLLSRSNADWLTVSPGRLTIPPKSKAYLSYKGKAPESVELKGSYWSVILIEPYETPSDAPLEKGKFGLKTLIRYAVHIATDIGDSGSRDIRFLDKKLVEKDEKRLLQVGVENSGERRLYPFVAVDLFDSTGNYAGRFDSGKSTLYPGCSVSFNVDLSTVPKGSYNAILVVDNGDDAVFGSKYKFTIE